MRGSRSTAKLVIKLRKGNLGELKVTEPWKALQLAMVACPLATTRSSPPRVSVRVAALSIVSPVPYLQKKSLPSKNTHLPCNIFRE